MICYSTFCDIAHTTLIYLSVFPCLTPINFLHHLETSSALRYALINKRLISIFLEVALWWDSFARLLFLPLTLGYYQIVVNQFVSDLFIGVISGLVATFFAVVFASFWKTIIQPWYEERVYKGVRIEGRWIGKAVIDGTVRETNWNISQVAHSIQMKAMTLEGPGKGRSYIGKGEIENRILTVTYRRESKKALERGCLVLKIARNGSQMKGFLALENAYTGQIIAPEYLLERDDGFYRTDLETQETSSDENKPQNLNLST